MKTHQLFCLIESNHTSWTRCWEGVYSIVLVRMAAEGYWTQFSKKKDHPAIVVELDLSKDVMSDRGLNFQTANEGRLCSL